jgi:hypothetical protein
VFQHHFVACPEETILYIDVPVAYDDSLLKIDYAFTARDS